MKRFAVIGAGFGDEGKGTTTAWLCSKAEKPLVVRFSGGPQAGHTVVHDGVRHIFSSFGSGTLQGVPTYWSHHCPFDPVAFMNELKVLQEKGVTPKIFVDKKCPIITPFDIGFNREDATNFFHGTCGSGVGATIKREEAYFSLLAEDLFYPSVLRQKTKLIENEFYNGLSSYSAVKFFDACKEVLNHAQIIGEEDNVFGQCDMLVFEGSQGLLLDKNIGFFPHVTNSNTGTKNLERAGIEKVFYVTRAYQTRHGNGPMTNQHIDHHIKHDPDETNQYHAYQGNFKRSILDLDLLEYAIAKDGFQGPKSMVVTCLDHFEDGKYYFTYKNETYQDYGKMNFLFKIKEILGMDAIYWSEAPNYENISCYSTGV